MVAPGSLAPDSSGPVELPLIPAPMPADVESAARAAIVAGDERVREGGDAAVDEAPDAEVEVSDGILQLLERIALPERRSRLALIDDRATMTYGALSERCTRFGAGLLRAGVAPGDRVMLCLLDTMDWPMAFLGTLQVGAVPVCADTRLDAAAYEAILRESEARLLVVSRSLYPAFDGLLQRIDSLARVDISEAPLADGGDMTVLLSHDDASEPAPREIDAVICRLPDGDRTQAWFDIVTGIREGHAGVVIEPADRCLTAGSLCEPAVLEQMLLPALAAGASIILIAEEEGSRALRARLVGIRPEHLEGVGPSLLFIRAAPLHDLLNDGRPTAASSIPLRTVILVDPPVEHDLIETASELIGVPVIAVGRLGDADRADGDSDAVDGQEEASVDDGARPAAGQASQSPPPRRPSASHLPPPLP